MNNLFHYNSCVQKRKWTCLADIRSEKITLGYNAANVTLLQ